MIANEIICGFKEIDSMLGKYIAILCMSLSDKNTKYNIQREIKVDSFQVDVLISSGQLNVDKEEKVFQASMIKIFSSCMKNCWNSVTLVLVLFHLRWPSPSTYPSYCRPPLLGWRKTFLRGRNIFPSFWNMSDSHLYPGKWNKRETWKEDNLKLKEKQWFVI